MNRRNKKIRKIAALICLALLCIGGTELAVCRVAAPDLFERLTTPVVAAARQVSAAGRTAVARISNTVQSWFPDPSTPSEKTESPAATGEDAEPVELIEPEQQRASAPTLETPEPVKDPTITEFIRQGDTELLTGGIVEFVYYCQNEAPWAEMPYGPDNIGGYGCGPTSMAMVVSSLTDQQINPAVMAEWAYRNGYCAPGSGSYHSLIVGAATAYGLDAVSCTQLDADFICSTLAAGDIFVALMGPGHFTSHGHFIVLRGITLDGKILVADPNSRERSLVAWDPEIIVSELSTSRNEGAPLWRISIVPGSNLPST